MREVIATGKTVDLAIEEACNQLGISLEEANIEVLEAGKKGWFRSVPARVRVTVEEAEYAEEKKVQPKEKLAAPALEKSEKPVFVKRENEKPAQALVQPTKKAEKQEKIAVEKQPVQKEQQPAEPATGEKAEAAVQFIRQVAAAMKVEVAGVAAVRQGESTVIRVEGEKVGALIGRRGETMEALSYLTGLVANRTGGDYEKISLDVSGYRSKREQDLAAMARRIGTRVQKTGRSQALEPMSSYDRRIVHSVIGGMENLTSESTGEGAARRVVIRSTAPGATEGSDRPVRSGKGRGKNRADRNRQDRKERFSKKQPADRPERKLPTGEEPVAVKRSASIDESFDLPLYGKIEF